MLQKSGPQGAGPQVPSSSFNDDSLLDADDSQDFQLRNQNYNLKIRINNLEYENNKLSIDYQNKIKELKVKNAALQARLQEVQGSKGEAANSEVQKLKKQLRGLQEENDSLKKELLMISQKNRVTPNFNSPQFAQDVAHLTAFLNRQESGQPFQEPDRSNSEQLERLRKITAQLEKQKTDLEKKQICLSQELSKAKEAVTKVQKEQKESIRRLTQQFEEKYTLTCREKDKLSDQLRKTVEELKKTIDELKNEQRNLTSQLSESKKSMVKPQKDHSDFESQQRFRVMSSQLREKDAKMVELEETVVRLEIEKVRSRTEREKLEQHLKVQEEERRQSENKRKQLQEQLYRMENDFTQAKAGWLAQKMDLKKQFNSLRFDSSDELGQLKGRCQDLSGQNKKLRDSFLKINEQSQELRKQIKGLQTTIEELTEEADTLKTQLSSRVQDQQHNKQYESEMEVLKEEIMRQKSENRRSIASLEQGQKQLVKVEEDLRHKEELIQILKIDKEEGGLRQKELEEKVKEVEVKVSQKDKVIKKLEQDIKIYKFDNKQLQIANDELRERYETLTKIKAEIEAMNLQLKTEKNSLEVKRREGERLKQQSSAYQYAGQKAPPKAEPLNKRGSLFSLVSSIKKSEPIEMVQIPENLGRLHSKESQEGSEVLMDIVKQLKAQNYELQAKIGQIESERDRKAVDLSIKEEQLSQLRQRGPEDKYQQKEVHFEPIIESSKRTQFNVVFFENQIRKLQQEVREVRQMRERELRDQKQELKRHFEEKYQLEMKRQQSYIHELEKSLNYMKHRIEEGKQQVNSLKEKLQVAEAQTFNAKVQLQTSLSEQNSILQKCKQFEIRCKEGSIPQQREQVDRLKQAHSQANQKIQLHQTMLSNANQQIVRLNEILMIKENELKSLSRGQCISPNSSFASQVGASINPHEFQRRSQKGIMSWDARNGPTFSRI